MKRIFRRSALALLLCHFAAPTLAEAQSGFFRFTVCNHTRDAADVAVHGDTYTGWELSGWYRVPAFQCRYLGVFRMGMFDTFARAISGAGVWDGYNFPNPLEMRLCLQYPGPFKRNTGMKSDVSCLANEKLEFMRTHLVTTPTYTWDLVGPR